MTRQHQTHLTVPVFGRILLYVRDIDTVAEFYARISVSEFTGKAIASSSWKVPSKAAASCFIPCATRLARPYRPDHHLSWFSMCLMSKRFAFRLPNAGSLRQPVHEGGIQSSPMPRIRQAMPSQYRAVAFRHGREAAVDKAAAGPRQTDLQEVVIMAAGVPALTCATASAVTSALTRRLVDVSTYRRPTTPPGCARSPPRRPRRASR